jgi:hypothetical protein
MTEGNGGRATGNRSTGQPVNRSRVDLHESCTHMQCVPLILVSQNRPVKPAEQMHVNEAMPSIQDEVPATTQGDDAHSLTFVSQKRPEKPAAHSHVKPLTWS